MILKMKRLWPFLLLNIVVSAATVLIVLWIWSGTHPQISTSGNEGTLSIPAVAPTTPAATLPALNAKLFEIQNVIGSGDLQNEHAHFVYLGNDSLNLNGWQITDSHQFHYTFPNFVIYKNGAFDLYSKAGIDSTIELFMAQKQSVWVTGETLTLLDSAGNQRLTYPIP
jgi:hypothetical protein